MCRTAISSVIIGLGLIGHALAQESAVLSVNDLNGQNGFSMHGLNPVDWLGYKVSDAGDINDDGVDDIAISALKHDGGGDEAGAVYVIFGTDQGSSANVDLSTLDGSNGFMLMGESADDDFGSSISNVGDINGDGVNELAISAYDAETPGLVRNGITYVLYGRASYPPVVSLSTFEGSRGGFTIHGRFAGDRASDVSAAGDFNSDGFADLIVGTLAFDPGTTNAGAAYVVFGTSRGFPAVFDLDDINGRNGVAFWGEAGGDIAGYKVSAAGDLGGDGSDDVMITAYNESTNGANSGAVYVVYGEMQAWPAVVQLYDLDGSNGFKLMGEDDLNHLGLSISGMGDFNADGNDDILMGAHINNADTTIYFQTYVLFGPLDTMAASQSIDAVADLVIKTPTTSYHNDAFFDTSFVGDLNGDGITDLAINDPRNSEVGNDSGAVYVVYGAHDFGATEILADQLAAGDGLKILGGNWNDLLGNAVSTAGDVNHDGIDDLLVGAHMTDNIGTDSVDSNVGSAYVIYGTDVMYQDSFEEME